MGIKEEFYNSPHLFQLESIEHDDFGKENPIAPNVLLEFWTKLGAGEIFETETIYSPSIDESGDTVLDINKHFAKKGMPSSYTVFHTGIAISAYRSKEPKYLILDEETFEVLKYFNSLEKWYSSTLRTEYAERYHMK
jgi:hypothetical protein